MSSFPILDLIAGIIFMFFLLSVICSAIVEMILTVFKTRAVILQQWITQMFDESVASGGAVSFGQELLDHCALTALSEKGKAPSYIDSKNFVSAVLTKISQYAGRADKAVPADLPGIITDISNSQVLSDDMKNTFLLYAAEAQDTAKTITTRTMGEIEMFSHKIENWYDTNMDRLSGNLKAKYTRKITFWIGIVITLLLNADTIELGKYLYHNPDTSAKIAQQAYQTVADPAVKAQIDSIRKVSKNDSVTITKEQLANLFNKDTKTIKETDANLTTEFPLGWSDTEWQKAKSLFWLLKLIGFAITVVAIMMGAPFWFDILNKLANLRGTGQKPSTLQQKSKQ